MFLSRVTPSCIATACGAPPNAVQNRLRRYTRAVPKIAEIHRASLPAIALDNCSVSKRWVAKLEEVLAYRADYGRIPHARLDLPEHARLGPWLEAQRRKLREGTLG